MQNMKQITQKRLGVRMQVKNKHRFCKKKKKKPNTYNAKIQMQRFL